MGTLVPDSLCPLLITQCVPQGPPTGQSQGLSLLFLQVAHLTLEKGDWPECVAALLPITGIKGTERHLLGDQAGALLPFVNHAGEGVPERKAFSTFFSSGG